MPDDLRDHEIEELAGEGRIEIRLGRQPFEPGDLLRLARGVRGRQVVLGLEPADGLGVLEPLGQREDEDGVQPVDAGAMLGEKFAGFASSSP